MNYRSLADMYDAITMGLGRLPDNIDLIVGVPRSAASSGELPWPFAEPAHHGC